MGAEQNLNKIVLIVDESIFLESLGEILKDEGISYALLDPTKDFTKSTEEYKLRAMVYEPYWVMGQHGNRFRPIVDRILDRAKVDGAKRIALSSQDELTLEEEGFIQGRDYDVYLQKPALTEDILIQIR